MSRRLMVRSLHTLRVSGPVRIFRRAHDPFLSWSREDSPNSAEAGSTFNVGEPIIRCYDHRDKVAVPIDFQGNTAEDRQPFLLFEELSPEDQAQIRRLFPENELVARVH